MDSWWQVETNRSGVLLAICGWVVALSIALVDDWLFRHGYYDRPDDYDDYH